MNKPQLRAEQGWIFDNFLMLSDNEDVLHPGIMGNRLERGTKFEDLNADLFKKTLDPVKQVLKDSGIDRKEVRQVVLLIMELQVDQVVE